MLQKRFCRAHVIKSCELLINFNVKKLKSSSIRIISAMGDLFLLNAFDHSKLLILSLKYLTQIKTINCSQVIHDASWTPGGHVAYTGFSAEQVFLITKSGRYIVVWDGPSQGPYKISVFGENINY